MATRGDLRGAGSIVSLTLPLNRLSKDFITVGGTSLAPVLGLIQSFMIPKSAGTIVKDELDAYKAHMTMLQATRGFTDADMGRLYLSTTGSLRLNLEPNRGFNMYLNQCFDVETQPVHIQLGGDLHPFELRVHRQLGHRYMRLTESGHILFGFDSDANELPTPFTWRAVDFARGFNDDRYSGFVRQ
jgi:hypothetical protein